MSVDFIRSIIELLAVTGGSVPIKYEHLGHLVRRYDGSGVIGGILYQIFTDQLGRLHARNLTLSSILGCGHLVTGMDRIAGFCQMCGKLCCTLPGCLEVCELTGITACRAHYDIYKGVVVSKYAQRSRWKGKAKRIAKTKPELLNARIQLPERSDKI